MELIPKDQPEHIESEVRLAEIYIAFTREDQFLTEVDGIVKDLFARDANSFDGHRLTADLDFVRAQTSFRSGHPEQTRSCWTEHRRIPQSGSLQPPTPALTMQLARALAADRQYAEAEQIYKQLIDEDKTFIPWPIPSFIVSTWCRTSMADAEQILKAGAANNPKQVNFLVLLAGLLLEPETPRRHGGGAQPHQEPRQGF